MKSKSKLTKSCWSELRDEVALIDKALSEIIDEINPSDDLPLYVAEYPYGEIIDDGVFYYPDRNGQLRPLSDEGLTQELKDDFKYAGEAPPAGMVLSKKIEVFTDFQSSVTPWGIYKAGQWFALSIRLGESVGFYPTRLICISSGIRSIYMLPKIGDEYYHKNLRSYSNMHFDAPKTINDHWGVFREISNVNQPEDCWKSKLLLLSENWIKKIKEDQKWALLKTYLFEHAWKRFEFDRNRPFYDAAFSEIQSSRNLRKDPHLIDTSKHILKILASGSPGFVVADSDESAPISLIQKVYLQIYGMSKYHPHIFVPSYFSSKEMHKPIYHSFQVSTALEASPAARKNNTMLTKIKEVNRIVSIFSEELLKTQTKIGNLEMAEILKNIEILFFHDNEDLIEKILSTKYLDRYDPALSRTDQLPFSYSGSFIRGCALICAKQVSFDSNKI